MSSMVFSARMFAAHRDIIGGRCHRGRNPIWTGFLGGSGKGQSRVDIRGHIEVPNLASLTNPIPLCHGEERMDVRN